MAKKNARNNKLLYNAKDKASPKIYSLIVKLVNEEREELAEEVLKVDYLLEYASNCIKQKDFTEAEEGLTKAKARINSLKKLDVDTEHLEYLLQGIEKKSKALV